MKHIYNECIGPWIISIWELSNGEYKVDSYHITTKERRDNVEYSEMNMYERSALNEATAGAP